MDINPMDVSTSIVTVLSPFMPYLINTAKFSAAAIGEMVVQKGGEMAWRKAQILWQKISNRYHEDGVINGAATMLAAQPENNEFQAILARQLSERLQDDEILLRELQTLLSGQGPIQKVLVDSRSKARDISQEISGVKGSQLIQASDDSSVTNVKQSIKN